MYKRQVINHSENIFLLQTRSNSYAFGIDDQGMVRHLYWGKRINEVEDFELPVLTEVSTNDPVYEIASPIFEEVTIDLGERYGRGKKFTIKAHNASRRNIYVQSARLNGRLLDTFHFPASELLQGGELVLEMGPEPNKSWGLK